MKREPLTPEQRTSLAGRWEEINAGLDRLAETRDTRDSVTYRKRRDVLLAEIDSIEYKLSDAWLAGRGREG